MRTFDFRCAVDEVKVHFLASGEAVPMHRHDISHWIAVARGVVDVEIAGITQRCVAPIEVPAEKLHEIRALTEAVVVNLYPGFHANQYVGDAVQSAVARLTRALQDQPKGA